MRITTLLPAIAGLVLAGAAWADHPTPGQMDAVRSLALDLEDRSIRVHRLAEDFAHHGSYAEREALADLHELERAASHFQRQVTRYFDDPAHTESDWIELNLAFERARSTFPQLHAYGEIEAQWASLVRLMHDLRVYYEAGRGGGEGIRQLAEEVEVYTTRAFNRARLESFLSSYWRRVALSRLQRVETDADRLLDVIRRAGGDPYRIQAEVDRLDSSFRRADPVLARADFSSTVRADFDRARDAFLELRSRVHRGLPRVD